METPEQFKSIFDFVSQVVVGAIGFAIILCVAAALSFLVRGLAAIGFEPPWFADTVEVFEIGLFGLDLFLFSLFLVVESVKLVRRLITEVRQ